MSRTIFGLLVSLAAPLVAFAAEAQVKPLPVFAVTGEHAGKQVDFATDKKDLPTVVIFISSEQWTRPVARYLKVLDTEIEKGVKGAENARLVAIWLTDDANQSKDYLPKAQMSLNLARTSLAVFEGAKAGPDGWNVDIASQVTAIVLQDGKEKGRFAYRSTNDQDVPEVVKLLGGK